MRVPGRKFLARLGRPVVGTLRPGGLILGYHRIADVAWDPLGLAVHPARFEQHLAVLRDHFRPVDMGRLVACLRSGEAVKDLCALTFDDGYRDLLDHAVPLLDRVEIPATVFVATGFAGRTFWWDEIATLLSPHHGPLPELTLHWDACGDTRVFTRLDQEANATRAVQTICRDLLTVSEGVRASAVEQIRRWRASVPGEAQLARAMSEHELRQLAGSANVEIGSHTVNHPMLAALSETEQHEEIAASWTALEALIGRNGMAGFSYPNGSFSMQTCRLVAQRGFQYACSSEQNVVRPGADVYRLPRVWAPDVDGAGFRRWLTSWRGLRT